MLVLTTYDTDSYVLPAIEAGAAGYLLKDAPRADLLRAVQATARGEAVLAPSVAAAADRAGSGPRAGSRAVSPAGPQPRRARCELAQRAGARGSRAGGGWRHQPRTAGALLSISEATVKTHLLHIYAKLGVSDRTAAVTEGFTRGILKPGGSR